jgi:FAD/FMN-containing dehydrogenase
MNSKIVQYLREHLLGGVFDTDVMLEHYSTDAGIFKITPHAVVFPYNESDVRKTMRFAYQLAAQGKVLPVVARGSGLNLTGSAITNGIVVSPLTYMNKVLEIDKKGHVTVQAGIEISRLQQVLRTHYRSFLGDAYSDEPFTVGGILAGNDPGKASLAELQDAVTGLRVVLSNGDVIETKRLSRTELAKKKAQATFEGELYRAVDEAIGKPDKKTKESSSLQHVVGINLTHVRKSDGSFDLTPLFIGTQGTLGIITEATLLTQIYIPQHTMVTAFFGTLVAAVEALENIHSGKDKGVRAQLVSGASLPSLYSLVPNPMRAHLMEFRPAAVVQVRIEATNPRQAKKMVKAVEKRLNSKATKVLSAVDDELFDAGELLWSAPLVMSRQQSSNGAPFLPILQDTYVPTKSIATAIEFIEESARSQALPILVWAEPQHGRLSVSIANGLTSLGDRQRVVKTLDGFYKSVLSLDGAVSSRGGEGRLKSYLLGLHFEDEDLAAMQKIKTAFDNFDILNPGTVMGGDLKSNLQHIRPQYVYPKPESA